MARNKIGFHLGPGGNPSGIGIYMSTLDESEIPFFIKSVDHYGFCYEASQYNKANHVIVFRISTRGRNDGYDYDVPNYDLDPSEAANQHWSRTLANLPPEFNKNRVWLEVINEVDKNKADWLGHFGYAIGQHALNDGYKVALFGWSSGEPQPEHWATQGMTKYLRLCSLFPNSVAIALHEYSYTLNIEDGLGDKVGRFKKLLDICDSLNISRPRILITEWGWEYKRVPDKTSAMIDIEFGARLYADYPEVLGAAIWYLGSGFSDIHNQTQRLIAPVTVFTIDTEIEVDETPPDEPAKENLLPNPSFEEGWYHQGGRSEYQMPISWHVEARTGHNNIDPTYDYVEPEVRTLPISQLPAHEQDLFVLDGGFTVKLFKGGGPIRDKFLTSKYLVMGRYELGMNIYADLVMGYENGEKVFADDPLSGNYRLHHNGFVNGWQPLEFGVWNHINLIFDVVEDGNQILGIQLRCPHALRNNGFFMDDWYLHKIGDPIPERQYDRTVHLLPQDATISELAQVVNSVYDERQSITFSFDDAFITHENLLSRTVFVWNAVRVAGGVETLEAEVINHYPPMPTIIYRDFNETD